MVSVTSTRKRQAFTLVELLVVIAIIGILVGLLMPAAMNAQSEARRTQCQENLRNVAMALANFESTKSYYPGYLNKFRNQKVGWQTLILEQLGNGDLYKLISTGSSISDTPHLAVLNCPADARIKGIQSYRINGGIKGAGTDKKYRCTGLSFDLSDDKTKSELKVGVSQISDGAANTILVGENANNRQDWRTNHDQFANCLLYVASKKDAIWQSTDSSVTSTQPQYAINRHMDSGSGIDIARPSSRHRGVALVAFADTHVIPLKDSIQYNTYKMIMCPNDTSTKNGGFGCEFDASLVDNNYP